jgi:hypothetical protein
MSSEQHVLGYKLEVSLSLHFEPYFAGYDKEGYPIIQNDVIFTIELSEDASSYRVPGLEPNTGYFVRLTAYNRAGSTYKIIGPIYTLKDGYITQDLIAWYEKLDGRVWIDWRGNDIPDYTTITYFRIGSAGNTKTEVVYNTTIHSIYLDPGTYLIRIQPCTETGCSPLIETSVVVPYRNKIEAYDIVKVKEVISINQNSRKYVIPEPIRIKEVISHQYGYTRSEQDRTDFKDNARCNPYIPQIITIDMEDVSPIIDTFQSWVSVSIVGVELYRFFDTSIARNQKYIKATPEDESKFTDKLVIKFRIEDRVVDEADHTPFFDKGRIPTGIYIQTEARTDFYDKGNIPPKIDVFEQDHTPLYDIALIPEMIYVEGQQRTDLMDAIFTAITDSRLSLADLCDIEEYDRKRK